jgi:hypothetical protein
MPRTPVERNPMLILDGGNIEKVSPLLEERYIRVAEIMVEAPRGGPAQILKRIKQENPDDEMTFSQAQDAMGAVWRHWRERRLALIDDMVAAELAKMDRLDEVIWPLMFTDERLDAAIRLIQISERRSRLMGLDAPSRVTQKSVSVHIVRGEPVIEADGNETVETIEATARETQRGRR